MPHPAPTTLFALAACAVGVTSQACGQQKPPSLVVVEAHLGNRGANPGRVRIVRYRVHGGEVGPAETFEVKSRLSAFGAKVHCIVGNRYLVTSSAGVIDLLTKRVVNEAEQEFTIIGCDPKRLVFQSSAQRRLWSTEALAFDFKSSTRSKIEIPEIPDLAGLISPDRKCAAYASDFGMLIILKPDEIECVPDASFGYEAGPNHSGGEGVPMMWLDARTLLSQLTNGKLVTVSPEGKVSKFVDVKGVGEPAGRPEFSRDAIGRLIYECGHRFVIDIEKRTAKRTDWIALGHEIFAKHDPSSKPEWVLREGTKEIGRASSMTNAVTRPGLLAIPITTSRRGKRHVRIHVWGARDDGCLIIASPAIHLAGWVD